MNKPTLYKKITASQALSRNTSNVTDAEATSMNNTITKFFQLFAAKHL